MNLLAIHYGHNCTLGYAEDGEIKFLASEERFCRLKNATGFPSQTLRHIVDTYLGGNIGEFDNIAIVDGSGSRAAHLCRTGFDTVRYIDYYWKKKARLLRRVNPSKPAALDMTSRFLKAARKEATGFIKNTDASHSRYKAELVERLGLDLNKVHFLDHHYCHATSAAYFKPVCDGETWLVLTLDAGGDDLSSTVSIFSDGTFRRISSNPESVSLGHIYAETTAYLGMKSNEHEFKLMGMAPYADPEQVARLAKELSKLIQLSPDGTFKTAVPAPKILKDLFRVYAFERFDVISGAVQKLTEDLICEWVSSWIKTTGIGNVAVSGGVFMNVKAAKKLAELPLVEKLFVVPSAADESLPIGALWHLAAANGHPIKPLRDLYLGRGVTDEDVEILIKRENLGGEFEIESFSNAYDLADRISGLLAQDAIVARCSGREEWGARALGNRSILCNPSKFSNVERLNSKIKSRDFWMPFTPSILAEDMSKYINNGKSIFAPYMAITFDTTPLAREHFAAAVHPRDFTMRPQEVLEEWNPEYHAILAAFKKKTGIGGVLNTSFNLHGEPNVGTPEDAIHTVRNSGLDYVVLGKFLLHKRH